MAERITTEAFVREPEATGAMNRWVVAVRLLVVIVGGYAAASALVAGSARLLPVLGLPRSEAVVLASILGFLLYLVVLVWGFSRPRLTNLVAGLMLTGGVGVVSMLTLGN